MNLIEKKTDISLGELHFFKECGYVSIDTETTGLNYKLDRLCTIQLYAENCGIIIQFSKTEMFNNLKKLFLSDQVIKIFHNAVFDVSFLMENLNLNSFGLLVCTKISSKIVNGLIFL